MIKIDWRGNSGYYFPDPGTVETAKCGVCNSKMDVIRNVSGATCIAMSLSGHKRLHDKFFCHNYHKEWHIEISHIKMDILREELDHPHSSGMKKLKRMAEKKIRVILKRHRPR